MKKVLVTLAVSLLTGSLAQAQGLDLQLPTVRINRVVLSEKVVRLPVDISTARVKLSEADYASPVVKVLIPELAEVTVLDHRNTGEGAPCMATYQTMNPEDIVQNFPAVETSKFIVTLEKNLYADKAKNTCEVTLSETIEGHIRGFAFTHNKSVSVGTRHIDDCK